MTLSAIRWSLSLVPMATLAWGCAQPERPARFAPTVSVATAPAAPHTPQPSPLPSGWAWPFDLRHAAEVFARPMIIRPVDVARLLPAAGKGPCSPVQVAQFVWTAPDCSSAATQPLTQSPFVSRRLRGADIALPAQVDLRADGLDGPVKNQQMVGVCWAFAISTVMDNALRRNGRQDVVAPLHVVASNTWNDIWRKGRSESALTVEPSWPYDPVKGCKLNEAKSEIWCGEAYHVKPGSWRSDPSLVAEVNRAQSSGAHRISRVETMQVRPADTNHIASALASRQAVFASFDYNRTAWSEFGSGGPVIPEYAKTDGAHAVVLVGYRTTEQGRQFLIHNSWGTEWRAGGYAWISEAMVQRHLRDAFTVEVTSTGAVPQVEPKPPPTAESSCPERQARDTVFGWCAPKCANGSGPTAMLCPLNPNSSSAPPSQAGSSTCAQGQVRDWLLAICSAPCRTGLPPMAGACIP